MGGFCLLNKQSSLQRSTETKLLIYCLVDILWEFLGDHDKAHHQKIVHSIEMAGFLKIRLITRTGSEFNLGIGEESSVSRIVTKHRHRWNNQPMDESVFGKYAMLLREGGKS